MADNAFIFLLSHVSCHTATLLTDSLYLYIFNLFELSHSDYSSTYFYELLPDCTVGRIVRYRLHNELVIDLALYIYVCYETYMIMVESRPYYLTQ